MNKDKYGQIILDDDSLFYGLYSGKVKSFDNLLVDKELFDQLSIAHKDNLETFNLPRTVDESLSIEHFDKINHDSWFMPSNNHINIIDFLYNKCTKQHQRDRVSIELKLFEKNNMMNLLCYLKFLVDTMRQHNIVWGVGRGSCVSSYVLYLLDVHKIDSLKYNLDINEFFKENI